MRKVFRNTGRTSRVFVKDFRRSWGVGGFAAGGSFTELTTESAAAFSKLEGIDGCRALRASSAGGCGLIVSVFDEPLDLSGADQMSAVLSVTGDSEIYNVKITLGGAERRIVYDVTVGEASRHVRKHCVRRSQK